MATMMFDNLKAAVANTRSNDIKMIDIDELHDSPDNFYSVDRIEELADEILAQNGVKENLIVKARDEGGYEIISGHRRKNAVKYLLDKGEKIARVLPCLVETYSDESSKKLDLILMNVSQRHLSDADIYKSFEELNKIFLEKKQMGEKFGKLRDKIAEILNCSTSQVGKLQNIDRYATAEVKEAVNEGKLSISTANAIARHDAEEQKKILKKNPDGLKSGEVKKAKSKKTGNKKVDTNVNFNSREQLIDFVSSNKEVLEKTINDVLNTLENDSSEKNVLAELADVISKF